MLVVIDVVRATPRYQHVKQPVTRSLMTLLGDFRGKQLTKIHWRNIKLSTTKKLGVLGFRLRGWLVYVPKRGAYNLRRSCTIQPTEFVRYKPRSRTIHAKELYDIIQGDGRHTPTELDDTLQRSWTTHFKKLYGTLDSDTTILLLVPLRART